ncbi:MAG TPA: hypothetical protein VFC53_09505 [Dehalococcoidia bacterium]|nr:hypothetical protein [Dehalococcoidia bacterium]
MAPEPIFEKSWEIRPIGYTLSVRARPSTIRRTVVALLPWALYAALPEGRLARGAFALAKRVSPLAKQKIR